MLNRRDLFKGLGAAAAVALTGQAGTAFAADLSAIGAFYLDITKKAHESVFAPLFAENKVMDLSSLEDVIGTHLTAYKAAMLEQARQHLEAASPETREELRTEISRAYRQRNGFLQPLKGDENSYIHQNGRYFREKEPAVRSGNERTNPLFLAIHDLALKGVITREAERSAIDVIADELYTPAMYESMNKLLDKFPKPTPGADAANTFKLKLK